MSLSSEIVSIVEQLNGELNQTEREAVNGVNLAKKLLSRFLDNAILAQYFAYFNTILFFLKISRIQIEATVKTFAPKDVPVELIQEVEEELQTLLAQVLEVKNNVHITTTRLDNWQ